MSASTAQSGDVAELPLGNRYGQQAFARLTPEQQERARIRRRRHCVYRHYDDEGTLLYVGISVDPGVRALDHALTEWVQFAVRMDGAWFDTWESAKAAEREAIRTEEPIYNVLGRGCRVQTNDRIAGYVAARSTSPAPIQEASGERPRRIDWSPSVMDQVTGYYRDEIRAGRLVPGDTLPANRPLAARWGISTRTALRAAQILTAEGWITTRSGKPPVVLGIPAPQRPTPTED